MISRRQFLRCCMYAAPAALVAPKAIAYFLPPQIEVATPEETNLVAFGERVYGSDADIIELIKRRIREAEARWTDQIAMNIYQTNPVLKHLLEAR